VRHYTRVGKIVAEPSRYHKEIGSSVIGVIGSLTNKENARPEHDLLLSCARLRWDAECTERIARLLRENIDWVYLIRTANQHRITPTLYQSLSRICLEAVPPAVMDKLRTDFRSNAFRNLLLTTELLKLLGLFKAHHISVVSFKGPILAALAYGDLTLRQFGDLDMLVHERDMPNARNLLIHQGYRSAPEFSWKMPFVREDVKVRLDLHWTITPRNSRTIHGIQPVFALDLDGVWSRLEPISLAGEKVHYFAPEDALLIHCQSSVKDYRHPGWPPLVWVCDIAQMIQASPQLDWRVLIDRVRQCGSQRAFFVCVRLAQTLLKVRVPEPVSEMMRADRQAISLATKVGERIFRTGGTKVTWVGENWFALRVKERTRDKIAYGLNIVRHWVTPNKKDRALFKLPQCLDFLYYLIRPLRLVTEHAVGPAAKSTATETRIETDAAIPSPPIEFLSTSPNEIETSDHKVEILFALKAPRVVLFGNLLTHEECDQLIALARPKLQRSRVVNAATGTYDIHAARTSSGTHFDRGENELVRKIEVRIAELLGIPLEKGEPIQVMRYMPDAEYKPHFDFFDPAWPGNWKLLSIGGQRIATLIMYLNDVEAGGSTIFPKVGLNVLPRKGNAVFFAYSNGTGELDRHTQHGGRPVGVGEKWIATKWLRIRDYTNRGSADCSIRRMR
jgi:prolyl 4-hydroxylase